MLSELSAIITLAGDYGLRRYELPEGMRYSTLKERGKFYREEFDPKVVDTWLKGMMKRPVFAVIIGRHTKIYPKKYREDASTTILIDEYSDLNDVRAQILEFLPESVYYDRNVYDEEGNALGQEMAFDLDPENLTCPIHGSLKDKMKRHQGLSFCELELRMVRDETVKLYEVLADMFSQIRIVYSGRGFHMHILDSDSFGWSYDERKKFALDLKNKGFLIDDWVTSGEMRLIRLPFSLHGMVSRIASPLRIDELAVFDPIRDDRCIPRFLKATSSF